MCNCGSKCSIAKPTVSGQSDSATFLEINHDAHTVATETVAIASDMSEEDMEALSPTDEAVEARLTSPVVTTFVDTEKIAFERNKSGFIPGWRSDKSEMVSGYECKVFTGELGLRRVEPRRFVSLLQSFHRPDFDPFIYLSS